MAGSQERLFESSARSTGDLAAVFEHDGETGSFYLYAPLAPAGRKIVGTLQVLSGPPTFGGDLVEIRWDAGGSAVGLFIGHELWAAFDGRTGAGYAGDYAAGARPELPPRIAAALAPA